MRRFVYGAYSSGICGAAFHHDHRHSLCPAAPQADGIIADAFWQAGDLSAGPVIGPSQVSRAVAAISSGRYSNDNRGKYGPSFLFARYGRPGGGRNGRNARHICRRSKPNPRQSIHNPDPVLRPVHKRHRQAERLHNHPHSRWWPGVRGPRLGFYFYKYRRLQPISVILSLYPVFKKSSYHE
jgi:hypothetical protein